jgi:hypothetical protein
MTVNTEAAKPLGQYDVPNKSNGRSGEAHVAAVDPPWTIFRSTIERDGGTSVVLKYSHRL